jgi:hypothetical protein
VDSLAFEPSHGLLLYLVCGVFVGLRAVIRIASMVKGQVVGMLDVLKV